MEIVAKENNVTILDHFRGKLTQQVVEDPMSVPRIISESWKPQMINGLPDAFCGEKFILFITCTLLLSS